MACLPSMTENQSTNLEGQQLPADQRPLQRLPDAVVLVGVEHVQFGVFLDVPHDVPFEAFGQVGPRSVLPTVEMKNILLIVAI